MFLKTTVLFHPNTSYLSKTNAFCKTIVSSQNSIKKYFVSKEGFSEGTPPMLGVPMVFQHSRSQALIKEEGCVRLGKNLATKMEMKWRVLVRD
jgi:hypothetical protein